MMRDGISKVKITLVLIKGGTYTFNTSPKSSDFSLFNDV